MLQIVKNKGTNLSKQTNNLAQHIEQQIRVVKKISQGQFGTVYLGINDKTQQMFAIKKFFVGMSNEKEKKKAQRESDIQGTFNHQNVVRLYQTIWQDQLYNLFMEYCPLDLQTFITNSIYPLDKRQNEIKIVAYQMLCGLKTIHEMEIIHRDLKPQNILISADGRIKIGDFGSAETIKKRQDGGGVFSIEGFSKWYTAPEILFGNRSYGCEVDMWSFACVYGELLNGLPLFPGQGEIEQLVLIGRVIGSANEDNWPSIIKMPDFGKINFKDVKARDLREVFNFATDDEIDLISRVLRYENRASAEDLLKLKYFNNIENQLLKVKQEDINQFDPYFDYLSFI